MSNMNFILFAGILLYGLVTCVVGQQVPVPECVPNNGFCQYHSECCSKSCLTFTLRCVGSASQSNNPQSEAPDFLSYHTQQIQLIEDFASQPQIPSLSAPASEVTLEELINSLFVDTSSLQQPALEDRFGADGNSTEIEGINTTIAPEVPKCKNIGEKCYRNSECCTQRCHGFLHQCVT